MKIDDFTMVILTHRCPSMLSNLLELYCSQPFDFQIVVADSSESGIQDRNATTIARFGERVKHARFAPGISGFEKMTACPELIATDFGMYAADDDLVILSGMLEALDFLRVNSDYSACHGVYYEATLANPHELNIAVSYAVASNDVSDIFGRLLSLSIRYQALFYSVMRRETFVKARVPSDVQTNHFAELYNALRIVIEGKVCGLRSPYIVRNSVQGDISATVLDRDPAVWIAKDSEHFWLRGYLPFRANLADALAPYVAAGSAANLVDIVYATFFARMYNTDLSLSALAAKGVLSLEEVRQVKFMRSIPNQAPHASPEVVRAVGYLMQRGWPAYA